MRSLLKLLAGSFCVILLMAPSCNKDKSTDPIPEKPVPGSKVLVWSDEFNYTGLPDGSKWGFDTEGNAWKWGNNEAQYYTSGRLKNAVSLSLLKC